MLRAFVNARILGDEHIETGRAVLVEDGVIVDVVAADDARVAAAQQHDLAGQLLLPGFIDTQVNGGGGVLFNDAPELDSVRRIAAAHARYGTTGLLPTLISDDLDTMRRAVAAVDAAITAGVPGILGIHLEGPFLSLERRGVSAWVALYRRSLARHLLPKPQGHGDCVSTKAQSKGRYHRYPDMSDAESGCNGHWAKHVSGVEMTDHHPIADVRPGSFSNQRQLEILLRRKAALGRYNQAGAIE